MIGLKPGLAVLEILLIADKSANTAGNVVSRVANFAPFDRTATALIRGYALTSHQRERAAVNVQMLFYVVPRY